MAIEDFTTYTEVDQHGDITVTAPKCEVNTMRRDATSWVCKDRGASHFGNFDHLITARLIASDLEAMSGIWGLSNGDHTYEDKGVANSGLMAYFDRAVATGNYRLIMYDFSVPDYDIYQVALNTTYYLTISRSATTATCLVYSDAERTDLLATLEVTCSAAAYQYIESIQSRDRATGSADCTCWCEDLDLQEPPPVGRSFGLIIG